MHVFGSRARIRYCRNRIRLRPQNNFFSPYQHAIHTTVDRQGAGGRVADRFVRLTKDPAAQKVAPVEVA